MHKWNMYEGRVVGYITVQNWCTKKKLNKLEAGTKNNEELDAFVGTCGQQVLAWTKGEMKLKI